MSEPYIGEIRAFTYNFQPIGWMLCAGQMLRITDNHMLFSLIGNTYGGDGLTTFALPSIPPLAVLSGNGIEYCIAVVGAYPPH